MDTSEFIFPHLLIAVSTDSDVMMSSDLYGTCSYCFYGTCPVVSSQLEISASEKNCQVIE